MIYKTSGLKLPSFITDNFTKDMLIYKAFDDFGLKDFSTKIKVNDFNFTNDILYEIYSYFLDKINNDIEGNQILLTYSYISHICRSAYNNMDKSYKLIKPIFDYMGEIIFNAKASIKTIISSFKKIKYILPLDQKYLNYKLKLIEKSLIDREWKVIFSTNPIDIATMSMRGIESCMRWKSEISLALNGSIQCPFTAVMYVTDETKVNVHHNKRRYGTHDRMIYRAVVRLVSDNLAEYSFFLERVYPNYNIHVMTILSKIIKQNLLSHKNIKLKVLTKIPNFKIKIPYSKITNDLYKEDKRFKTYSDAGLLFEIVK